jgi:hypothetical protein
MPYRAKASGLHLHGLHTMLAYRNGDGRMKDKNCGLAAAATALHHKHRFTEPNLYTLEDEFPPDVFFGLFGTSKDRVCEILNAYGCHWREVRGEAALKHTLQHRHPVLVMLSIPWHEILWAGHWMVAFAYDEHGVHLTNYKSHNDRLPWSEFRDGWDSVFPAIIHMRKVGIAIH